METIKKQKTIIKCSFSKEFDSQGNTFLKNKIRLSLSKLERAINSAHFKNLVTARPSFHDCDLDPLEVYFRIMEGAEYLSPELDYEWDVTIIPYYSRKNVVGYTYPNRKEVWVNTKYYKSGDFGTWDIANNFAHEYMHKLGFKHSFFYTPQRGNSVPYAIGEIVFTLLAPDWVKARRKKQTAFKKMTWIRRTWLKVMNVFF